MADGYSHGIYLQGEEVWLLSNYRRSKLVSSQGIEALELDPVSWVEEVVLREDVRLVVHVDAKELPSSAQSFFSSQHYVPQKDGSRQYDLDRDQLLPLLRLLSGNNLEISREGYIKNRR